MSTSDTIQAALLCVQITVGVVQVVTTVFFIRSVRITASQERDAKEQIGLAREQMRLMSIQYRESLRPLIAVSRTDIGPNVYELDLRNDGLGPALNIHCDPSISLNGTVIGTKSSVKAYVSKPMNGNLPYREVFVLTYHSIDGHRYETSFCQQSTKFWVIDYRSIETEADAKLSESFREGYKARTGA